jgi:hypothetical protein
MVKCGACPTIIHCTVPSVRPWSAGEPWASSPTETFACIRDGCGYEGAEGPYCPQCGWLCSGKITGVSTELRAEISEWVTLTLAGRERPMSWRAFTIAVIGSGLPYTAVIAFAATMGFQEADFSFRLPPDHPLAQEPS